MILSDLIGLVTDVVDTVGSSSAKGIMGKFNAGNRAVQSLSGKQSIKNKAKNLVLQYPMLTSTSISSDTALVISRALEREYVNLITIVLNSTIANSQDILDNGGEAGEFLKKYHSNITRKASMVEGVSIREWDRGNRELLTPYSETINLESLNELSFPKSILKEAKEAEENKEDKKGSSNNNSNKGKSVLGTEILSKMDVKKLNDMSPTVIKTTLKIRDTATNTVFDKDITFGVKGVIHPLDSADIVFHLADSVKSNSKLFKLIQWTTGEIKFFRDLVVSLDVVKATAVTSVGKDSFWWRKLKSMANDNFIRRLLRGAGMIKDGSPIPTATMIISKQDVDTIKNRYGIDFLSNPGHAMTLMKKLFLLGFVIVDESTNMVYLLNDVSKDYDYYTLNALKGFSKEDTSDMDVIKSLMKGR